MGIAASASSGRAEAAGHQHPTGIGTTEIDTITFGGPDR
ncbi:hypothetical protein MA4S0726RB_4635 [Mycobacteroides abscessus 4S-0726-RB]|nr:hypothetical protein MA4S0726RB_4635 [Mycobacteroides abscessus 4S-0726-RB]EIU00831.1 hypothetical protein MA4S0726RA_0142 [Mycobacteroides abscessus 4S-0726-RA]EIU03074.1 hypothetical protein MA4S0303_0418 [Mycobacteroides abscessus 4S-0303]EIV61266.1 hypothetical protein MA4S0116S_4176 [Mycobacteroides abscessus 4S-0116-S]